MINTDKLRKHWNREDRLEQMNLYMTRQAYECWEMALREGFSLPLIDALEKQIQACAEWEWRGNLLSRVKCHFDRKRRIVEVKRTDGLEQVLKPVGQLSGKAV